MIDFVALFEFFKHNYWLVLFLLLASIAVIRFIHSMVKWFVIFMLVGGILYYGVTQTNVIGDVTDTNKEQTQSINEGK